MQSMLRNYSSLVKSPGTSAAAALTHNQQSSDITVSLIIISFVYIPYVPVYGYPSYKLVLNLTFFITVC